MNDDDDPQLNDPFNGEEFDENEDFFPKHYDLEEVFDKMIHPMIKTVINICQEYNIPMLTTFQYKSSESQVNLCTSMVIPPSRTCEKIINATKELIN